MKIKLAYPKIPSSLDCPLKQCVVFEKLDGTNIHFVFSKDKFVGFGTRRDRFPSSEEGGKSFSQAHPELKGVLDCDLLDLFSHLRDTDKYNTANEVVLFFEYCGPNSFAGQHRATDTKQLYLIDVEVDGRMLPPEEFLEDFVKFKDQIPRIVFQGKFSGQVFVDVRKGKLDVKEGVVVKGVWHGQVYMAKIKTEAYLDRLKNEFKDNWNEYWE